MNLVRAELERLSARRFVQLMLVLLVLAFAVTAHAQQPRTLKVQSAVPPSSTAQDALKFFADRERQA